MSMSFVKGAPLKPSGSIGVINSQDDWPGELLGLVSVDQVIGLLRLLGSTRIGQTRRNVVTFAQAAMRFLRLEPRFWCTVDLGHCRSVQAVSMFVMTKHLARIYIF